MEALSARIFSSRNKKKIKNTEFLAWTKISFIMKSIEMRQVAPSIGMSLKKQNCF